MKFKDVGLKLSSCLMNEFNASSSRTWSDFITNKDIGLEYCKHTFNFKLDGRSFDTYRIVNEKKWMLSKLKYGL